MGHRGRLRRAGPALSQPVGRVPARRGAVRPGGARVAPPRGRALHRTRGRHRGRVPAAAPGARGAGRRLDRRHRRRRRACRCANSPHWPRRPARRCSTGVVQRRRQAGPGDLHRQRQGAGAARHRGRHRRGHRDRRRRARPGPASRAGGRGQGQGHRPHRRDPGHLRPARQEPRGQGAGRAGAAAVHAAPAPRLGRVDVPPGRWPGGAGGAGMGSRGPGETKIELDRRRIRNAWPSCAARSAT